MKKVVTSACAIILSAAVNISADNVELRPSNIELGGDKVHIVASLSGNDKYYTGYNIDIELPEGWDMQYYEGEPDVYFPEEDDSLYPKSRGSYKHQISSTYGVAGERILRVTCLSTNNDPFQKTSGDLFYFSIKASVYAKPGQQNINLSLTDFGTYDAVAGTTTPYHFDDAVDNNITVSASEVSLSLNISSVNKWSTCILPFDYTPSGFTAYNASETSTDNGITYVNLTEASTMEAYKPYIVYAEAGFSNTLSGTVNPANYPDGQNGLVENGLLKGTIVPTSINSGYVLQNQGDGAMFYNVNNQTFSIPAGKCWMELPTLSNAPSRIVMTTNEATALENVSVEAASSAIYTVTGQLVSEPIPGNIYIQKGKKVLIVK